MHSAGYSKELREIPHHQFNAKKIVCARNCSNARTTASASKFARLAFRNLILFAKLQDKHKTAQEQRDNGDDNIEE